MVNVNENIKYLRKKLGYTQEQFAELIGIKRSLVGAYEEGRADPRLNNLVKMAEVFDVTLDALIGQNLTDTTGNETKNKPVGATPNLRVLSITVDRDDKENIEFVPQKASAGYLNGYADPEYISDLPKFNLPNLPTNATYRAFEISGDSMLPILPGSVVIGKYVENIGDIKNGKTYVLVTSREGIVYKRVFNYLEEKQSLYLVSDNKTYSSYEVAAGDVMEIWEAKAYISMQFPEPDAKRELSFDQLTDIVLNLKDEVVKIKDTMSK